MRYEKQEDKIWREHIRRKGCVSFMSLWDKGVGDWPFVPGKY